MLQFYLNKELFNILPHISALVPLFHSDMLCLAIRW